MIIVMVRRPMGRRGVMLVEGGNGARRELVMVIGAI